MYLRDTGLETRYPVLCIPETLDWRPDILCCAFGRNWTADQISYVVYSRWEWTGDQISCAVNSGETGLETRYRYWSSSRYSSAKANAGTVSHINRRPSAFTSLAINRCIFSTLYDDIVDKKPCINSKILTFHLRPVDVFSRLMLSSVQAKIMFIFFIYEHLNVM